MTVAPPLKGIIFGIVFLITALIYATIPTYLVVTNWIWLNEITLDGKPVYTFALFALFFFIVAVIIAILYVIAMLRAFIQSKNEDLGIPRAVWGFAVVSTLIVIGFMLIWYLIFHEIAFFSWKPL